MESRSLSVQDFLPLLILCIRQVAVLSRGLRSLISSSLSFFLFLFLSVSAPLIRLRRMVLCKKFLLIGGSDGCR